MLVRTGVEIPALSVFRPWREDRTRRRKKPPTNQLRNLAVHNERTWQEIFVMHPLSELFENNRAWAGEIRRRDPGFFARLAQQQSPRYLWIGCSDSRVPANEICGLAPGEMFVHRNVANLVVHTDLNGLSVMQFAVDILKVRHIIVTGHYGCGGVRATWRRERVGLTDHWLRHVQDVRHKHSARLAGLADDAKAVDRLCELNVIEQVLNVCHTTIVRHAWEAGQELAVHGWIYGLHDGLLRDLGVTVTGSNQINSVYQSALDALA